MAQDGNTSETDPLIGEAVATPFKGRCLFTIRVVPFGLSVVLLLFVTAGIGGRQLLKERLQRVVRLDLPKEPCASYPWLVYQELMYSNLGNVGPDSGNGEGMVIRARDMGGSDPARFGKNTFLVFNSTDDKYKAAAAHQNGLQGCFGAFNLPESSELNFKLSFRDENETELTMKRFALTFFDLDFDVDLDLAESVAIAGYDKYFTTPETELQTKRLSDGLMSFAASTVGTGTDNPVNPMAMTQLQKNRAVSFIFENVTEIVGSVRTSSWSQTRGEGVRVFNFVSKNSLACARDAAEIPGMPLQDLNYHLPMEHPVALPANAIFDSWVVNVGDRVEKGDTLALINDDGTSKEVKSDKAGTVITQQPLVRGDIIGERLIELNAAVVELDKLPALHASGQTSKAAVCSADNRYFKKYHVVVGDNVEKGDKLATTTLVDGSSEEDILAPKSGGIAALQPLKKGDPCQFVEDMNLVTLGKFAPLSANIGETPVPLNSGDTFGKWLVDVGDAIKEGQLIAVINTGAGTTIRKKSAYNGTVVGRQALLPGSALDEALPDETLVLVRSDGRLRPLDVDKGEESINTPKHVSLVAWKKHVGDSVGAGETIATFSDENGRSVDAFAPRAGTVTATVQGLKPGDKLDDVMSTNALATIGDKLRPLTVRAMESASHVPEDNLIFKKWLKLVGQNVTAGEVICVLQDKQNKSVNVTAEVHGVIVAEQDLKPHDVIDNMVDVSPSMDGVKARVLAVIDLKLRGMQAGDGETASSWKDGLIFKKWKSKLGDNVTKGQTLATLDSDGTEVAVSAPRSGFITAVQEGLIEGTALTNYPGTIATIANKFRPLKVLYGDKGHDAEEGDEFDMFLVTLGEKVQHGQGLAKVTTKEGKRKELKCERAGLVVALQDPLKKGMKTNEVMYDQNLVVTGLTLRSLEVRSNEEAVKCSQGSTFKEWVKNIGDRVGEGDVIATVKNAYGTVDELAPRSGVLTDRQKGLREGMEIDNVLKDRNLAVVADTFGPLDTVAGGEVIFAPPSCIFKKWHVNVGDTIKVRDPVATLKNKNGKDFILQAPKDGLVKHRQEGLQEGMDIDDMCEDDSLIVVGKLPALTSNDGMAPVMAPEGTFVEWSVEVGDEVAEGDPVALIKGKDGQKDVIKAPKSGTVYRKQEHLMPGSDLAKMLEAGDICVIGRLTEMKPTWTERAVDAPPQAIFENWHAKKEQRVDAGDLIATVTIPSVRRLEADHIQGRRLEPEWITQEIKAPRWGTVTGEQPLLPGMTVGDQQVGSSIATIDSGTPWWISLLCILAILCCCLCCLFCVMKKAPPVKEELVQELEEPADLGLDFYDGEKIHRIYPKFRPLGIKHDHEAPIIVREFTINSYAKSELEIQRGWKLVAINGEQLNDSADFAWVSNKLGDYMKDFDLWPLALEFKAKGNEVTKVEFLSRPIGVEFEKRTPIRVSWVMQGSPAEEKGITRGMLITKIGLEDVSGKRQYQEVLNLFKEAVISLDTSDGHQVAVAGQNHCFDGPGGHVTAKESSGELTIEDV